MKITIIGAEVVLVEKDRIGGTCLNRGCIPTKAFLASYDTLETVKKAESFGIKISGAVEADYPSILARKNKVMGSLVRGIEFLLKKTLNLKGWEKHRHPDTFPAL